MNFDVTDKVALVTGSNRGIGKEILKALIENGAQKVYAAVRRPESADPLVETYGDKVVALPFDLAEPGSIFDAAKEASDVNLVINNAGVLRTAAVTSDDVFRSMEYEFNTNVYGLVRVIHAFVPVLKANGGGAFVQLNSVASLKAFDTFASYCASKAAAYSLTQSLRESLKDDNILVMSVHPGPIATDMGAEAGLDEVAEPASVVADALLAGLKNGDFHVFPDSVARQVGDAYHSFAQGVIEAEMSLA